MSDTTLSGTPAVARFALLTIRQMWNLRRYNVPVKINNPKQVNIAANGGQQVNVQDNAKACGDCTALPDLFGSTSFPLLIIQAGHWLWLGQRF